MPIARADIPRLVCELRERTGLTQEQSAARLGVTFPTVSRWENGRAKPSPLALKQIEDLLRELGDKAHDIIDKYFGDQNHGSFKYSQPNMGLTSWKGAKVYKGDVTVAKNYLITEEIEGLKRIVTMCLDYVEDQARRRRQIFMRDWRKKLDAFLQVNEREIPTNAGKVNKAMADQLALEQYGIFHQHRMMVEAEQESLADDAELKRYLESRIGVPVREVFHHLLSCRACLEGS